MAIFTQSFFLAAALITTAVPNAILAESILFESGTLGPTGVAFSDLVSGTVPNTSIDTVFAGVRFMLEKPVLTSHIGGHFVSSSGGTFFGGIVALSSKSDVPDSKDLSTTDVLGTTQIDFPLSSAEIFGELQLSLDPGWYALVFGSGKFGANGEGAAVRNGMDIGEPSYIAAQPIAGTGWHDLTFSLPNHRFVLQGQIVPEVSSMALATIASLLLVRRRTYKTGY